MTQQITNNFNLYELYQSETATRLHIDNSPCGYGALLNLITLSFALQRLRDSVRMPIHVTSGYRCERLNTEVNGVKDSYHMRGAAADIKCSNLSALGDAIRKLIKDSTDVFSQKPILKVIKYPTFYHLQFTVYGLSLNIQKRLELLQYVSKSEAVQEPDLFLS